ncbi:Protein NRT1/ PTR FAMILY 2.11 [Striga hermonthica]|uniref:Protein NRT1/ PTR FAMILY 2.11 n=1 Tax=Striga hermonthica TaxID=68872 RepID=A0A9N7NP23_STRHE|nr:Protein NRT1/ PTR FAMILY 2.11 [Striga hermonthica]
MEKKNGVKALAKKEPNYRGIKAMPFVIGNETFEKLGTIGTSTNLGIRPCNLAFGADQFDPGTDSGKRGINSFFNWYYFTFTFAMMVSLTVIVYVQSSISWAIGLGIPTFLMFLSCVFFFIGTRIYVVVPPQGSPLTSVVQTVTVAVKKRRLELPELPEAALFNHVPEDSINSRLAYSDQLRFLNKAAILTSEDKINSDGSASDPWNLRSVQQVEEIKCVVRVIPIWIACIVYFIFLVVQSYTVLQALQVDRRLAGTSFKIPAASYTVLSMLTLTIWIPIYDRVLVPLLRRVTRKDEGITLLQRLGIGLVFAILTMFVSGLVENRRRILALTEPTLSFEPRKGAVSSMSGNWLIPQLALAGMSEAFCMIGQYEFYYKQFPENMRSFGGSFVFMGYAAASYLGSLLILVVHNTTQVGGDENWLAEDLNKGRLDYFYYLVGVLEALNLGYFLICSKWFKYKRSETMDVAMEKIDAQKGVV